MSLRGNVNVDSGVPLDVKIHGTPIGPVDICKTPAPPWPVITPTGNVNVSGIALLTLDMDQSVSTNVTVTLNDTLDNSFVASAASMNSVSIRNSKVHGDVNVANEVPLTVRSHRTSVGPMACCETPTPPRSVTQQGGNFNLSSSGPLHLAITQTTASGGVAINMALIHSTETANSIRLVDSVFGSLRVIGSNGRDELDFARLHVLTQSRIGTGNGNDSLRVVDTVFSGFTILNGGDDTDALVLRRTRFPLGSTVVNWE